MYLPMVQLNIPQFKKGTALCALLALLLFTCSFVLGKNEFFLLLNADLGLVADYFLPHGPMEEMALHGCWLWWRVYLY